MAEREYVLGTQSDEVERLGLQHRVWRPIVLEGFARAGIANGQVVIDVGAGPGFGTADLAELVGPDGRVIALQLLLLLAWRVAGYLGMGEPVGRLMRRYRALLPRRRQPA